MNVVNPATGEAVQSVTELEPSELPKLLASA